MASKLVCFDSTIFKHVFRDPPPQAKNTEEPSEYELANKLSKRLDKAGYRILVPSIVLSEAACIFDAIGISKFYSDIAGRGLIIGDFTQSASQLLARILHERYYIEGKNHKKVGISKAEMKYDAMIVAIAAQYGCDCLYTTDEQMRKYPNSFITLLNLYETPPSWKPSHKMRTFFDEEE